MSGRTLHEFRPSWAAWFWLIVITFGIAIPYVWWRRRGIRYEVTDTSVIQHTGRISASTDEFQLDRVTRIQTNQSFIERIVGVGSITVDTGDDEMTLTSVPNYKRVADSIRNNQN